MSGMDLGTELQWGCEAHAPPPPDEPSAQTTSQQDGASFLAAVREAIRKREPEFALRLLSEDARVGRRVEGQEALLLEATAHLQIAARDCSALEGVVAVAKLRAVEREGGPRLVEEARASRHKAISLLGLDDSAKFADDFPTSLRREFENALEASIKSSSDALVDGLVEQSPYYSARFSETVGLPRWAEARRGGAGSEAERVLSFLEQVGLRLQERGSDRQLAAIIRELRASRAHPGPGEEAIEEALKAFRRGADAYERQAFAEAEPDLREAAATLADSVPALAGWPRLYLAVANSYSDAPAALSSFQTIAEEAERAGFSALAGRARWLAGTALVVGNRFEEASQSYATARRLLHQSGGDQASAFIDVLEAEAATMRGDHRAAWSLRSRAFRLVPRYESLRRQLAMYWEATEGLSRQGRLDLAEPILNRSVQIADAWKQPLGIATARLQRAKWLAESDAARSQADLLAARVSLQAMPLGAMRIEMETLASLDSALIEGAKSPERGAKQLSTTLETLRETGRLIDLLEFLPERARLLEATGHRSAAIADLKESMEMAERIRRDESTRGAQDVFARRTRKSLDRYVDLVFESAPAAQLIATIDRFRNRSLVQASGRDAPVAHETQAIPVPAGGETLFVHTTDGLLYEWLISQDQAIVRRVVPLPLVKALVDNFRDGARRGDSEAALQTSLLRLYDLLLRDFWVGGRGSLAVVADSNAAQVPWHALREDVGGKYLIERSEVALYPNLASIVRPVAPPSGQVPEVVLVEGSSSPLLGATPLALVADELAVVRRSVGPTAVLLAGADATVASLERRLMANARNRRRTFLHFAGHALESRDDSSNSYLLLPGGAEWRPGRVANGALASVEMVVLSACSTLDPLEAVDSATFGLGGSFFAAGARAVVGTSLATGDREAAAFASLLYQEPNWRLSPASRFRDAIFRARKVGGRLGSPGIWGEWSIVGGIQ
jgi:CHAT domain-containing protein